MSYLVLARKWRPKRFAELVGQEHVVRALSHALETGRVHHAFLFTGTRGVGKTTIARIFAKSLNCERGTGAEPCGQCAACLDIDSGRFVDLLEIDAASNTGVDDVRALIENAQYLPARGRTKVYLIDEVHMLSKSAFNALLKTLEEPPEHVKFLLATTDPQKLPVTVLSRCLQFNLRRLEPTQIAGQMSRILQAEDIEAEAMAVALLARAADGSLRDGLSLLDQAIAYGGGKLEAAAVNAMLGTVEHARLDELLQALADGDGARLLAAVDTLAQYSPDFAQVLEGLAVQLHHVQLHQLVPGFENEASVVAAALGSRLSPELVQLWYQMAVSGRRDLSLAPSPRAGFEMALLRMLAFRPASASAHAASARDTTGSVRPEARISAQASVEVSPPSTPGNLERSTATPAVEASAAVVSALRDREDWLALIENIGLKGPALQLASHSVFCGYRNGVLKLSLADSLEHLRADNLVRQLAQALATGLGEIPQIRFEPHKSAADSETLHARGERQRSERQSSAEAAFFADPVVNELIGQGATVVPDSIRPVD